MITVNKVNSKTQTFILNIFLIHFWINQKHKIHRNYFYSKIKQIKDIFTSSNRFLWPLDGSGNGCKHIINVLTYTLGQRWPDVGSNIAQTKY